MSSDFNPYREWLSIPVSEQPANYYRLLGVPLFEPDLNVISNAADRQMSFIRTFQTGKYSEQSQRILNELATARVTLLDKRKKAEYDAKLRTEQNTESQSPADNTPAHGLFNDNANKNLSDHRPPTFSRQQSIPIATPPSIPSRTPLLSPIGTLSIPSITPPPPAPKIPHPFETLPAPPIPSTPQPSEKPHTPSENPRTSPAFRPSKSKNAPSPQPASSVEKTSAMNPSISKKNWIALIVCIVVIPLLIGTGLLIQRSKTSSKANHAAQNSPDVANDFENVQPLKNSLPQNDIEAGKRVVIPVNGVEFAFRWCPPGTFTMGSPESEEGRYYDERQHQVTLTKGFWMMETEVTQKQWKAVMGNNPSGFKGDDLPVESVSWNDCQEFCKKCSQLGLSVQLPTEAQWEYACRAGSTTAYFWGNALNGDKANCNGDNPCGTKTKGNYLEQTTPVGSYEANAWGLYDMHGNVREFCADRYGDYPSGSVTDPVGPSEDSFRVDRGGSWRYGAGYCRSATRGSYGPFGRGFLVGFRVVRVQ